MRRLVFLLPVLLLLSCGGEPEPGPPDPPEPPPQVEFLQAADHLTRASLALRAVRPSPEDLRTVQLSPNALEPIIDSYLRTWEFGEMIRDMHAESLLMRNPRRGAGGQHVH